MHTTLVSGDAQTLRVDIKHVPLFRPLRWLRLGWADMRRHRGASVGYGALIVALGWTVLVLSATHPYYVAAAITGFLLVGPVMSAGLCELSRRDSRQLSANFDDSLDGFTRNSAALIEFGLILAASAFVWFALSALMLGSVFRIAAPDAGETLYRGFVDSANRSQFLSYAVVGGLLACAVFALSVVAIPMILDRHASAGQAARASLRAVAGNVPAMIVWGFLITLLTLIGYVPLLFGLVLIAPLLGHATWHAYEDMIR